MFIINPHPPALDPDLVERYQRIEPATIGHRLNAGFVGVDIRGVWRRQRITGRAITVRSVSLDSAIVHKVTEMLQPDDVVVIDQAGERDHSCFGGGLARACQVRGAVGAVIDGPITDVNEIEDWKFPVWGRGWTCLTTRLLGLGGEINVPVRIGNAVISPGDLIVADDSGVVALAPETARQWLPEFEAIEKRFAERSDIFATGVSLPEMSGANKLIQTKMQEFADMLAKEKK